MGDYIACWGVRSFYRAARSLAKAAVFLIEMRINISCKRHCALSRRRASLLCTTAAHDCFGMLAGLPAIYSSKLKEMSPAEDRTLAAVTLQKALHVAAQMRMLLMQLTRMYAPLIRRGHQANSEDVPASRCMHLLSLQQPEVRTKIVRQGCHHGKCCEHLAESI